MIGRYGLRDRRGFQDQHDFAKAVRKVLESTQWLPTIDPAITYERLQDDHDGTYRGWVRVTFGVDQDAWLWTDEEPLVSMRFREPICGGGMSPRTRMALLILAEAIRMDNEERPQRRQP